MSYWPSSFFACLWTATKSRAINSQKKNEANIQPYLVNIGFIMWLLVKFCLRDRAGSPERARWLHLARSGSQSQRAVWFILPARGASHIITQCNTRLWILFLSNKLATNRPLLNPSLNHLPRATQKGNLRATKSRAQAVKFFMQHLRMLYDAAVVWLGRCNNVAHRHAH